MLHRVLEPEVMDSVDEACDYDAMDHHEVNQRFVADLLATGPDVSSTLDLGTASAQIPIELCRQSAAARVVAIDAARAMLALATENVQVAGLSQRIVLHCVDAARLPFAAGSFRAVISNSIVHHIPEPQTILAEAVRVCAAGGTLFFRDLMRPIDLATLDRLVEMYAADANAHQRQMFHDSLHAALSLEEIRRQVESLGFKTETVQPTSDRHWTWFARNAS
jgi:ubiquinone/menaquinone biosynthesis C-methylase UbiE